MSCSEHPADCCFHVSVVCFLSVLPLPRTRRPHCHRALPDHLVCPDLTQLNFFKDSPWFLLPHRVILQLLHVGQSLKSSFRTDMVSFPSCVSHSIYPSQANALKHTIKKEFFKKYGCLKCIKEKRSKKPKELHVSYSRIPMDCRLRTLELGGTFCKTASSPAPSRGKTHRFSQFLGPLSSLVGNTPTGSKEKRSAS